MHNNIVSVVHSKFIPRKKEKKNQQLGNNIDINPVDESSDFETFRLALYVCRLNMNVNSIIISWLVSYCAQCIRVSQMKVFTH